MLDHADTKENNKRKTFKPNDKTKSNTLQVTGGAMFSNTSVALVVGDKALCMAKTGSSDDCGMRYDALTGTMKFIISDNITVEVGVGLYNWCQTNGKAPVTNIPSGAFMLPRK